MRVTRCGLLLALQFDDYLSVDIAGTASRDRPLKLLRSLSPLAKTRHQLDDSPAVRGVADVEIRPRVSGALEKIHFKMPDRQGRDFFHLSTRPVPDALDVARLKSSGPSRRSCCRSPRSSGRAPRATGKTVTAREFQTGRPRLRARSPSMPQKHHQGMPNSIWKTAVTAPMRGGFRTAKSNRNSSAADGRRHVADDDRFGRSNPFHIDVSETDFLRYAAARSIE